MNTEPITITEGVRTVILAVIGLTQAFDVWHPTAEQNGAILTTFLAVSALLSVVARRKSTPTNKVALTKQDVELIQAAQQS